MRIQCVNGSIKVLHCYYSTIYVKKHVVFEVEFKKITLRALNHFLNIKVFFRKSYGETNIPIFLSLFTKWYFNRMEDDLYDLDMSTQLYECSRVKVMDGTSIYKYRFALGTTYF